MCPLRRKPVSGHGAGRRFREDVKISGERRSASANAHARHQKTGGTPIRNGASGSTPLAVCWFTVRPGALVDKAFLPTSGDGYCCPRMAETSRSPRAFDV